VAHIARERSVYRYFDLADSFVQILVKDGEGLALPDNAGLNRAGYRRMVIAACMPDFKDDVARALETLFPEDPLMVEDLLYQLCIEINPALDIHEVHLTLEESERTQSVAPVDDPGQELLTRLRRRAQNLEGRLAQRVIGQGSALEAVARVVRRAAVGLGEEGRPLASFLLIGRTGTGKTELARALSRELFARGETREGPGLVRIDCSEYASAHEYSKLIGSPPGYVGHDEGGQLTDAVASAGGCVVLFDEVEKAHPRMHNLLLQILEEGELTDSKGRRVSFAGTVVILTSNAGADEIASAAQAVGFGSKPALGRESLESITETALGRVFSPEFLGRLDEQVLFDELRPEAVERIAAMKLQELACRTRARGTRVAFTPAVARWVAQRAYSPEFGAREVRRVLQRDVEPEITERMLEGAVDRDQLLRVRVRCGALCFEVED